MTSTSEIQWKRLSAEAIAIIASILLAFWIDAWWEDKQIHLAEREILSALVVDLEEKRRRISWNRQLAGAIMQSAEKLLSLALDDTVNLESNEIDKLLGDIWWVSNPAEWTTGFLESLALSGQLSSISNATLRNSLGELWIALRFVGQLADDDKLFVTQRQLPYMSENAFLPQILNAIDHQPGHPEEHYVKRTITNRSIDHAALLQQRQFQNLLIERVDLLKSLDELGWNGLDENLIHVLELLYAELGKGS